jgi:hypothetical protein
MPQIIGSSGQTVNAVGQSTMAVHASVVRAVGALTAAAGATPLIRAAERSVYADTITLAATDGVIVGNGTVDLPTIASQDEDPQAFLISAVGGAITVVPHEDDEAIFGLDNQLVSEVTVEANTVLTLLRYVGVWRVIDSSAASLALGETSSTAYRGDRGKTAYDHSQLVTGNPHGTTAADVGADPAGTAAGLVDDLSGVSNQATARTNLGLGTAATAATGDFAAASHTHTGTQVSVDASGFNGNLTTSAMTRCRKSRRSSTTSTIPAAGIADPGGANDDFVQRKSGAWTHRTPAQVKTDLGVNPAPPPILPYAGMYQVAFIGATNTGDAGLGAVNRESYIPMFIPGATYDRIGFQVQTTGTLSVELGLYSINSSHHPASLIVSFGTLDLSVGTGLQLLTISQAITTGWYYIGTKVMTYTSSPVMFRATTSTLPGIPGWPVRHEATNEAFSMLFKSTGLSGGGLPATAPAVGTATGNAAFQQTAPRIYLRHG